VTDLVPVLLPGRLLIERYGPGGFRIGGVIHRGPVLVFRDRIVPWTATGPAAVTRESLDPVIADGAVEILILGCGRRMTVVAGALRAELRRAGIAVEAMATDAACRTYNLLLGEDRRVAAALFPPA
jgi:uncharacterized protein